jgi:hypothetical protein
MPNSYLQDAFLHVFAATHKATAERIVSRLRDLGLSPEMERKIGDVVFEELRGLYHGNLVVFDGGSSLADHGLIKIVDEEGAAFATNLHETCFQVYDSDC